MRAGGQRADVIELAKGVPAASVGRSRLTLPLPASILAVCP